LKNRELSTLREGYELNEKIIYFMVEYFREKVQNNNMKSP